MFEMAINLSVVRQIKRSLIFVNHTSSFITFRFSSAQFSTSISWKRSIT